MARPITVTKEILDEIIKRRYSEGLSLSSEKIVKEEPFSHSIIQSAKRYYGTWQKALDANNVPRNQNSAYDLDTTNRMLYELQEQGHPLTSTTVDKTLLHSAVKNYGSWKHAVNTLGLKQNKKKRDFVKSERRIKADLAKIKWTEDDIRSEITKLIDEGLTRKEIHERNPAMFAALIRRYGNLSKYCKVNSIVSPRKRPSKYSKDDIDTFILNLVIHGKSRSSYYIKNNGTKEEGRLVDAAKTLYGSWNAALIANDVDPMLEFDKYSKEDIVELFKRDYNDSSKYSKYERYITKYFGSIVNLRKFIGVYEEPHEYALIDKDELDNMLFALYNDDSINAIDNAVLDSVSKDISYSIKHYYGSLTDYFSNMDIDFYAKKVPFAYTAENSKRQLMRMITNEEDVNYTAVVQNKGGLVDAGKKFYGSYEGLFEACGLDYNDFRTDTTLASYYGIVFENLVGEIFTDLGYNFSKYEVDAPCHPDFVLGSHWIDAKLSQWTANSPDCNTIRKYEPHCDTLTLVFLRGDKSYDKMITSKTRLVNIYYYVEKLIECKRQFYYEKLNELEIQIKNNVQPTPR